MNILYIGPLLQHSFLGKASVSFFKEISQVTSNNNYVYPIYGGSQNISYENVLSCTKYPDINIQHCTIIDLHPDINSKTYFVPIMSPTQSIPLEFKNKLELVDKILTTNNSDYNAFVGIGIKKDRLIHLKPFEQETKTDTLSLPVYEDTTKFYAIAEDQDMQVLKLIISNFLQIPQNNSLVIYCRFDDRTNATEIIDFYRNAKKYYNVNIYTDRVFFMFDKDEEVLHSLHNAGDVFLALNQDYFPVLQYSLSRSYGNRCIDYSDLDLDINNNHNNTTYTIINKSLQASFQTKDAKQSKNNEINIKDLLC